MSSRDTERRKTKKKEEKIKTEQNAFVIKKAVLVKAKRQVTKATMLTLENVPLRALHRDMYLKFRVIVEPSTV